MDSFCTPLYLVHGQIHGQYDVAAEIHSHLREIGVRTREVLGVEKVMPPSVERLNRMFFAGVVLACGTADDVNSSAEKDAAHD